MQIALAKPTPNSIFFFGIIVLFCLVSLVAINTAFFFTDNIYNGVSIGNVPVGGLSVDEAKNRILATFQEHTAKSTITVRYQSEAWSIAPKDIDLAINADHLAMQAYNVGRTGSIINLLQERYLAINGGYTIPFTKSFNHDKLYTFLTMIARSIDINPQNASITYKDKNVHIIPETWGQHVDSSASIASLASILNNGIIYNSELTVKKQAPIVVSQDLTDIDNLISTYTTQFDPNNKNRYQNVKIAAQKIHNILIRPGEVFSFNQFVGLRLPEYGFKEAPVFVDGKLLLDWGGGVCQVSTTLYNAALLADMGIEERTAHFQPPSYVPLGQDAAVADNLLDFKFKNTSPYNIYITSEISNNQITVLIFGKKNPNAAEIRIEGISKAVGYNTIIKQDNSLPLGTEIIESGGQQGFEATTYRVKILNGKEASREFLAFDEFKPENRIIRIGTKSRSRAPAK